MIAKGDKEERLANATPLDWAQWLLGSHETAQDTRATQGTQAIREHKAHKKYETDEAHGAHQTRQKTRATREHEPHWRRRWTRERVVVPIVDRQGLVAIGEPVGAGG